MIPEILMIVLSQQSLPRPLMLDFALHNAEAPYSHEVLQVEAARLLYVAEQLERAALGHGDLENLKRAPGVLCFDQSAGSGDAGVGDHPIEEPW